MCLVTFPKVLTLRQPLKNEVKIFTIGYHSKMCLSKTPCVAGLNFAISIFFIFRSYSKVLISFELCKHVMEKTGENNPCIVDHMLSTIATGYSALHCAAEFGCLDVARLIINRIEDKNPIDSHKNTCLHYAARHYAVPVYKFFMNNAEENMPENFLGWTPCHQAAYSGNLKVFELILKNHKDKNPPSNTGDLGVTPLHLAAQEGHVHVMLFILKYVSEKNPQKRDEITPLHMAAYRGQLEACKILMEKAIDKEPTISFDFQTPVLYAMQNNHDKVVKYIAEYLRKDDLQRKEGLLTRAFKKIYNWLIMLFV